MEQLAGFLNYERLPFAGELTVEVADTHYSQPRYLHPAGGYADHVVLARVAANRTSYRFAPVEGPRRRGHPRWYGAP